VQPPTAPPPIAGIGLEIQVGAYPSSAEAERQIALVRTKGGGMLTGRAPAVQPVRKEHRTLYRARFTGFDARTASAACLELRRLAIDCFVMRPE
jgi:D-alanyl-D-alanine carboxypeptidase